MTITSALVEVPGIRAVVAPRRPRLFGKLQSAVLKNVSHVHEEPVRRLHRVCASAGVAAGAKEEKPKGGQRDDAAITPKSEDYSKWYLDVIREAELADYGPVRGTMVIRPYGYALWEGIQTHLDGEFKKRGVQNAYFPQLIPYSFITKEADHVEGFAPELALVTQGGGKELEEPLVVRPTSETMVNHMFSQWVRSYRDLPLQVNQWCNVHRWEMRTRPFLRTLEFLWQEGHTAHATAEEAEAKALEMIRVYEAMAVDVAALPVVVGHKSRIERFAGAVQTYTIEAMMGDRRALQSGTSHNLGTNFSEAFDTRFLSEDNALLPVHQSSWGVSTRLLGGIIMAHGDDKGLRLPPALAPVQVVIVPIVPKPKDRDTVVAAAEALRDACAAASIRVQLDDAPNRTPGWKFNFWEMKGVPVRCEEFGVSMEPEAFVSHIQGVLDDVQRSLLATARQFRDDNITEASTYDEFKAAIDSNKWVRAGWAGSDADEKKVKEETGATIRCFPFAQPPGPHTCFYTGQQAEEVALFAKAY